MATTNTTNKNLNIVGIGDPNWGVPTNSNVSILDKAFGGLLNISDTSGVVALSIDDVQNMCLRSTGSAFLANVTYRIPSGVKGQWVVQNRSGTSTRVLTIDSAGGGTSVTVPRGSVRSVYCDGTNVIYADTPASGDFTDVTVSGTLDVDGITTLGSSLVIGGDILTDVATESQAISNSPINTVIMTPLRTLQSINDNVSTTYVQDKIADGSRGAIGTYAFAGTNSNTAVSGGGSTSGSNLRYASIYRTSTSFGTYYVVDFGSSPLSGNWRLMGETFSSSQDSQTGLFLRIS
jgi:hypothetical protein